jgi:hypothetical protein
MRRALQLVITVGFAVTIASATTPAFALGAQRPNPNASCQGFLAGAANPNEGVLVHELVKPEAAALGEPQGALISTVAADRPTAAGFPGLLSCVAQVP